MFVVAFWWQSSYSRCSRLSCGYLDMSSSMSNILGWSLAIASPDPSSSPDPSGLLPEAIAHRYPEEPQKRPAMGQTAPHSPGMKIPHREQEMESWKGKQIKVNPKQMCVTYPRAHFPKAGAVNSLPWGRVRDLNVGISIGALKHFRAKLNLASFLTKLISRLDFLHVWHGVDSARCLKDCVYNIVWLIEGFGNGIIREPSFCSSDLAELTEK